MQSISLTVLGYRPAAGKLLKHMQDKGSFEITEKMLAGLSPYRTIHINRFGDYLMDLERAIEPMNTRIRFGFKKQAANGA